MRKYTVLILGDKDDHEVSIVTKSHVEIHGDSYGWFSLDKILISSGEVESEEEWNDILETAKGLCERENTKELSELKSVVSDMCSITGKNTAHDYDGIEDMSDVLLYLKSIKKSLNNKAIAVVRM
jgi:hypothetical protein